MDEMQRLQLRQAARRRALNRLGVTNIQCLCGECDPRLFEADHIYRREFDGKCWGLCLNCHRRKSIREFTEHPKVGLYDGNIFERRMHAHLGIAQHLEMVVSELRKMAELEEKLAKAGIEIDT